MAGRGGGACTHREVDAQPALGAVVGVARAARWVARRGRDAQQLGEWRRARPELGGATRRDGGGLLLVLLVRLHEDLVVAQVIAPPRLAVRGELPAQLTQLSADSAELREVQTARGVHVVVAQEDGGLVGGHPDAKALERDAQLARRERAVVIVVEGGEGGLHSALLHGRRLRRGAGRSGRDRRLGRGGGNLHGGRCHLCLVLGLCNLGLRPEEGVLGLRLDGRLLLCFSHRLLPSDQCRRFERASQPPLELRLSLLALALRDVHPNLQSLLSREVADTPTLTSVRLLPRLHTHAVLAPTAADQATQPLVA